MNSMTPHEDDVLARALRGQVDGMTEAPLTFDDIAGRAGVIRRRRRVAVASGVVAAVAAVVIPTAVLSGGTLNRSEELPPATSVPSAIASTLQPVPDALELSISGLTTGAAPRAGWVEGDTAHLADGSAVTLPTLASGATISSLAELDDNLVLGTRDDRGNAGIVVATRGGGIVTTDRSTGRPVLSADSTVAAYVRPDGTPVLLTDGGQATQELPSVTAGTPYLVAVSGSAPCDGGCTVWVNDVGRKTAAYRVDADGVSTVTTTTRVNAVSGDRYLGNVSLRDDLFPVDGVWTGDAAAPGWTADSLIGFSPDGRWVVGQFFEGLGGGDLVIYDAETGQPQVQWGRTQAVDATALAPPVWEDETHLVQLLTQGRDVVIARYGLDGSLELTGVGQQVSDPTLGTLFLAEG